MNAIKSNYTFRGYLLACIASCTYGLNPLFAKPLYAVGMSVSTVLCYRYALAAAILAVIMLFKGVTFKIPKRCIVPIIVGGILFALSSITLFESYKHMDVGIASTILYVTPVFVALIMAVLYRQRISGFSMLVILIAMVGIACLSLKSDSEFHSMWGFTLAALSAFAYAAYMVLVNKSKLKEISSFTLSFYSIVIGIVIFGFNLNFFLDIDPIPMDIEPWANLIGLAIFPTIISIVCTAQALHDIGPQNTSMLGALEPLTALVVGCLVFGEVLTPLNIVGVVLVLGAVTLLLAVPILKAKRSLK